MKNTMWKHKVKITLLVNRNESEKIGRRKHNRRDVVLGFTQGS